MPDTTDLAPLLNDLQTTLDTMPPVVAMGIRIAGYDNGALRLTAPAAANVNDKGNAFGGSLASVMTLAGWGLVSLRLSLAGRAAGVYVADSSIRYRAPVYGALDTSAWAAPGEDWETFLEQFDKRGRARMTIRAQIEGGAAELEGRFVALAKG
ncbi:MAG: YiiD C-terminal domain-containing protein [Stenotrophomonas sp.]